MEQKHFMDIQHIREDETELRKANTGAFQKGDIIQVTEKFDGSCACATWDNETNQMVAFSRKKELDFQNTLNGFWNFVQTFTDEQISVFREHSTWRCFGEWNNKNKIIYTDTGKVKHWYVYDIFDVDKEKYLSQDIVKQFCKDANLEYIHELYYGPFVSWEHCRSFMNSPAYGEQMEGIVVKLQSKCDSDIIREPFYLKIVNEDFKESIKTKEKIVDPDKENARQVAKEIMECICTSTRVEKELFKMRDEGIIPAKIEPTDFNIIARNLPKRIWDDLIKEEKELVTQCGEYAGKICSQMSMAHARSIILGK